MKEATACRLSVIAKESQTTEAIQLINGLPRHYVPRNDKIYYAEQTEKALTPYITSTLSRGSDTHICSLRTTTSHKERGNKNIKKAAFTLAEVLITLGIIGVVAAMTLPIMIQKHRNHVVETRLKKFYSTFNQAIQMSVAENGDISTWWQKQPIYFTETDENGNYTSEGYRWFMTYVGQYMQLSKVTYASGYSGRPPLFYFSDGSAFTMLNDDTTDIFYFTNYDKCKKFYGKITSINREPLGRCAFAFLINFGQANKNKGLESWTYNPNKDSFESLCKADGYACSAVIERNGWKIPANYTRKVIY